MGCTKSVPVKYTDKVYYEACEHDTIEEINVALGTQKHVRHIVTWKPVGTAKAIVLVIWLVLVNLQYNNRCPI